MRAIALGIAGGLAIGLVGWGTDDGSPVVRWTSAIAAGWFAGAFLVGALARDQLQAAVAGATAIVAGVATYYALFHFVSGDVGLKYGVVVGLAWATAGVAIGAVLGWAGDAWRRRHRQAVGVALLGGALAGEAILLLGEHWHNRVARVVLVCELVLGAMLPFALARRRLPQAIALTALVAVAVAGVEAEVREAVRAAGWRGA